MGSSLDTSSWRRETGRPALAARLQRHLSLHRLHWLHAPLLPAADCFGCPRTPAGELDTVSRTDGQIEEALKQETQGKGKVCERGIASLPPRLSALLLLQQQQYMYMYVFH